MKRHSLDKQRMVKKLTDKKENILLVSLMIFLVYSLFAYMMMGMHIDAPFSLMVRLEGLLGIALLCYGVKYKKAFHPRTLNWCVFIGIYMLFELLNSFIFAEIRTAVTGEIVFWIFFFGLFFWGASDGFWSRYVKWGVAILILTSLLSLYELYFGNFTYLRSERDVDANSYLYIIQIGFVPLFVLMGYYLAEKNKAGTITTITIFIFYIVLQFIFQKRLPLVRCVLTIIMLLYILKGKVGFLKSFPLAIIIVSVVLIGVIRFAPQVYVDATLERFTKSGTVSQTTQDDERYLIFEDAMRVTFDSPRTALFGQGLGGAVRGYFWGKTIVDASGRELDGLESFEIGVGNAIFKYGIIYLLFMYGFILKLLLRYRQYRNNSLALGCWMYLFIFFIFNFIGESFPNHATIIFTATLAPCMGYLASFKQPKVC